jgi:hypothetical protein
VKEANVKFAQPAHWIEDESVDEDADPKPKFALEADLRNQVSILRSHCADTKSALVSWNGQTKQMFFNPDHAIEELTSQIKNHWGIPRKVYWLQINGNHESQVQCWPKESSVVVKVTGLGGCPIRYRFAVRHEGKRQKSSRTSHPDSGRDSEEVEDPHPGNESEIWR